MKTLQELQRLAASKLPEKIIVLDNGGDSRYKNSCNFGWRGHEGIIPKILDTEWPYIVQELLEPMMTTAEWDKYLEKLWDVVLPYQCNYPWGFNKRPMDKGEAMHMVHANRQQRLTAMDEINFFDTQK